MVHDDDVLDAIVLHVSRASGIDFAKYRRTVVRRRVEYRMHALSVSSGAAYLELLRTRPAETPALVRALLVQTTQMFRDQATFRALRDQALPALFAQRAREGATAVRAWVPACATGEEAFSLAMCLREAASSYPSIEVSVLATDIDENVLALGRAGAIRPQSLTWLPRGFETWFRRRENDYAIVEEITSLVMWARHDLLTNDRLVPREAVIASFDLVSCQNFFIYVDRETQRLVYERLTKSLAPSGLLVLGRSECPVERLDELAPAFPGEPIFRLERA